MAAELTKETLGMLMIGDGVLGVLEPERHTRLWQRGPDLWQRSLEPFARHPGWTRLIGAAEAGLGLWLASQQQPSLASQLGGRMREVASRQHA